ncbi:MAG TPA: hypothetical protein VKB96_10430, partial [Gammaproteobacteria bacterium]|nr:hypothetical protein [Gammaproteobacteria bacterium]
MARHRTHRAPAVYWYCRCVERRYCLLLRRLIHDAHPCDRRRLFFLTGWGWGLFTLLQVWRSSDRPDKRFALVPFGCVTAGRAGVGVYTAWLIMQDPD